VGPKSRSGRGGEAPAATRTPIIQHVASFYTTELPRLLVIKYITLRNVLLC